MYSKKNNKLQPNLDYRLAFNNILLYIAEQEEIIEQLRCILCQYEDFEPYSAYKRLDKQDKGLLNMFDIQLFLRENAFYISDIDIIKFVQHYDTNQDGHLSYIEFLKCVLPKGNSEIRTQATQRPLSKSNKLNVDVEKSFARLIESEIRLFHSVGSQIQTLKQTFKKVNATKLFLSIDINRRDQINFENLDQFFKRLSVNTTIVEQQQIINILQRISRSDEDWSISFEDFENFFFPVITQQQLEKFDHYRNQNEIQQEQKMQQDITKTIKFESKLKQSKHNKVQNIVDFHLNRNQRKYQPLNLCYTSDSIGVNPQNQQKIQQKPQFKCLSHPDKYEKHDLSIAQMYKHQEPYRKRLEKYSDMNFKTYKVFTNKCQNPGNYVNHEQYRKIHQKELYTFLLALQEIFHLEKQIYEDKIQLALRPDFTIQDFFSFFDEGRKQYIDKSDIQQFFENFIFDDNIDTYVDIFQNRYDLNRDGKISFIEFCDRLIPNEKDIADVLRKKTSNGLTFDKLQKETQEQIFRTLECEIINLQAIQQIIQSIQTRSRFDLNKLFSMIDLDQDGYINLKDLIREYKTSQKPSLKKDDLKFMLQMLGCNKENQLTYSQLLKTFDKYIPISESDDENTLLVREQIYFC